MKRNQANCMSNVPLLETAKQILERYKDHPVCIQKGLCLPVLSNQKMNSYLKEIADFCGITKNLTTHLARHRIFYNLVIFSELESRLCWQVTI